MAVLLTKQGDAAALQPTKKHKVSEQASCEACVNTHSSMCCCCDLHTHNAKHCHLQRTCIRVYLNVRVIAAGKSQSVTYTAPFTFPWLETGASEGQVGVKFTAGKKGQFLIYLLYIWRSDCPHACIHTTTIACMSAHLQRSAVCMDNNLFRLQMYLHSADWHGLCNLALLFVSPMMLKHDKMLQVPL